MPENQIDISKDDDLTPENSREQEESVNPPDETATLNNAFSTGANKAVELKRLELRDDQAQGRLPQPGLEPGDEPTTGPTTPADHVDPEDPDYPEGEPKVDGEENATEDAETLPEDQE